jgi:chaperonin GroES
MEMTPYGDYLLLKERAKAEKTKSGIIITNGIDGDYVYADVEATGPGLYTTTGTKIPMTVEAGDVVLLHTSMTGDQKRVKLEDTEYLLVRESEIVMLSKSSK